METPKIKVKYCDKGLANFYGTHIEINRKLKDNKILRDYIVKHELGHKSSFDLDHEIKDGIKLLINYRFAFKLIYFYLKNPSTWIDLLPIQIKDRSIVYDLNLIILYVFFGMSIYISLLLFF